MCLFLFFLCCLSVPLPALMMEKKNKIKSPLFYDPFLFELLWLCLTFHSTLEMSFHSARHFVPSVMRRCRLSISKLRTRTRTHGAHPHTLALGNSLNHTLMHTHTHTHVRQGLNSVWSRVLSQKSFLHSKVLPAATPPPK